jgi:two-component system, OmpR family, sensor kinase
MSVTPRSTGFWQSVRQLPGRMPLRIKLISAVLALVAVALVVISVAGVIFLRGYLTGQADNSLQSIVAGPPAPQTYVLHALNGSSIPTGEQVAIYWLGANGKTVQAVQPVQGFGPNATAMHGPRIQAGASWLSNGQSATVAATSGGGHWRVAAYAYTFARGGQPVSGKVIVAVDFSSAYRTLAGLTAVDLIVSLLLLLVLAVVGTAVVRASLRPLNEIEQTAGAIAAGDLTRRVPERDPRTEVGRLGRSLNVMLSQIEAAFRARSQSEAAARRSEERLRQFVADASHELRTPLTAIRGFAEYYRQRGGSALAAGGSAPDPQAALGVDTAAVRNGAGRLPPTDLDRIMRRVEQESARMGVLVEDMLLLARLDQQRPLDRTPVDLLTLAADAVHDARVVAPERSINLSVGAGAALLVNGDEVRLRQVIGNLMSNALSHTPDGTAIDVRIRSGSRAEIQAATSTPARQQPAGQEPAPDQASESAYVVAEAEPGAWPGTRGGVDPDSEDAANAPSAAVLEVTDHGPGMTQEQARHAFERFYRADQARTSGGTGLGLAIVAALVKAHGGAVWVRSRPGEGATFFIALPLAPEAVQGAGHEDDAAEPEAEPTEAEPTETAETEITGQGLGPAWTEPGSGSNGRDSAA